MQRTDLHLLMDRTFDAVSGLNGSKGMEYADDTEALRNFYRRAEEYGVDPKVVLGIFLGKHLDAIATFIRSGEVRSEPIEGRVHDAILYLVLLLALIEDEASDEQAIVELAGENQLALDVEPVELDSPAEPRHAVEETQPVPTLEERHEELPRLPIEHQARNVVDGTQEMPSVSLADAADPHDYRFTAPFPRPQAS